MAKSKLQSQTLTSQGGKKESGSPYQINPDQALRASTALSKHIAANRVQKLAAAGKRDLLDDDENETEEQENNETDAKATQEDGALWLVLSTKKYISEKSRAKPYKIRVPNPIVPSSNASICIITADPQRRYKDIIADPAFPATLRHQIGRVIGISKLKAKFKSFESRRQLAAEHIIFFADDRIITALPFLLGKAFYKSSAKRPIPISLVGNSARKVDKVVALKAKKDRKSAGDRSAALFGTPKEISNELTKALSSALVHLSPSVTTSVRVGWADWKPTDVRDNVLAVVDGLLKQGSDGESKIVPGGWKNVRSIYLKGSFSAALPLWLASELWEDEGDIKESEK